jgi:hypothetical protein
MYLPLGFWNVLIASEKTEGTRGGRVVSYDNIERHITNTQFISLAEKGWIGSRSMTSDKISGIIAELLENGHSIILSELIETKEIND